MKVEDALRKGLPTKDEDYDNLEYNPVDGEYAMRNIENGITSRYAKEILEKASEFEN